jgi:hypothetical protein
LAIYHLEAKVVSRGAGRSAAAAAAYLSCSRIYNDYDGIQHDYTRKQGLVWQQVFLPPQAPPEWQDREKLWNAVEAAEKAKDSRLARELVVALPIELNQEQQISLIEEFIQEQFVADGMCADAAIHDTDGHNPHAHILLTVRPLDEKGQWQYKTEKEYLCVRNGEERGFTTAEFLKAQKEGWEKQYPYKIGKKKVYMAPSAAEVRGLARADKHPKSSRYGRQNPITLRWNSEEQLLLWRENWAAAANLALEQAGREERIDHRSHAARGLEENPTIHEGVAARAMERKGITSDRCELNRQIKADNTLLRQLKAELQKLAAIVAKTVPAIAEALEKIRGHVMLCCFRLHHIRGDQYDIRRSIGVWKPEMERYMGLVQQIKEKGKERTALVNEKKELPIFRIIRSRELAAKIAELTEDLEDLRSEKARLLEKFSLEDSTAPAIFRKEIATMENSLKKLTVKEKKYSGELDAAIAEYEALKVQSADVDPVELYDVRHAIRPEYERAVQEKYAEILGKDPTSNAVFNARYNTDKLLHEKEDEQKIQQTIKQRERENRMPLCTQRAKSHRMDREGR